MTARSRHVAVLLALLLAGGCGAESSATTTSLTPLVPPAQLPGTSAATTTTVAPSSDPNDPLIASLPDGDCAYAPRLDTGEITFIAGDRLDGASPDGSVVRCLASLAPDQRGPAAWSPDGARVLLASAWLYDMGGFRQSGFEPTNTGVRWEWPTSTGLFAPSSSQRTLVRRDAADPRVRTEITFLATTTAAVAHPAGEMILGAGTGADGTAGVYTATGTGSDPRLLVATPPAGDIPVSVPELAAAVAGDVMYFVADTGTSFRLEQLSFAQLTVTELSKEQAPVAQLTTGPSGHALAWRVGLCNSVTRTRVLDERTGLPGDVGTGTPIESLSLAPVGWLDGARLVVAARPLGCDGPADIWIWNVLDGSATLLAKTVEHAAVRTAHDTAVPMAIAPDAVPGTLP